MSSVHLFLIKRKHLNGLNSSNSGFQAIGEELAEVSGGSEQLVLTGERAKQIEILWNDPAIQVLPLSIRTSRWKYIVCLSNILAPFFLQEEART